MPPSDGSRGSRTDVFQGCGALLAGKALYGGQAAGRITVGVALPENDILAKQVTSMLSSLESVKSICDLSYMSREECLEGMENGELLAALLVPEGFVQDIMSGVNTPVPVLLPENAGVESRIFKELADAGAQTLSAAQAGIYAGDEVLGPVSLLRGQGTAGAGSEPACIWNTASPAVSCSRKRR